MNSKQLQSEHSEIYKKFFTMQDLVISNAYEINFPDQIDKKDKSNTTTIPLCVYVWIKKIQEQKTKITGITEYNPQSKKFISSESDSLQNKFENFKIKNNQNNWGISISILSELPLYYDLWWEDFLHHIIEQTIEKYCNQKIKQTTIIENNIQVWSALDIVLFYSWFPSLRIPQHIKSEDNESNKIIHSIICSSIKNIEEKITNNNHQPEDIFQLINYLQHISLLHRSQTSLLWHSNSLIQKIHENLINILHAIIPVSYDSLWWCYLIIAPQNYLKWKIDDIQQIIWIFQWTLIYYNSNDGTKNQNKIIEHFSEQWVNHELVDAGSISIFDNNDRVKVYDSIDTPLNAYDILVDSKQWRIFIGWQKLSSIDLMSQHYTCHVIKQHMQQKNIPLNSSSLPMSSYSKNKSEFMGKIAYPLEKVIQNKVWKHFKILCEGKGCSFRVKLDYHDLSIWCIS